MVVEEARGTTPAAPHDDEVLIPYTIALFSFCLVLGLLLAVSVLPLAWLPAQFPLLVVLCYAVPLAAVFSRRYQATLDGLAAREYGTRAMLLRTVVAGLVLIGLPLVEWTRLRHGDWMNGAFGLPVITALVTVTLAWSHASGVFARWSLLHMQSWEDGALETPLRVRGFDEQSGGRVDRTREIRRLWRDFAGWGVGLTLALFAASALTFGGSQPSPLVSGLLVGGYTITGTLLIGRSALVRLATEWRLDRLTITGSVGQSWGPTTTVMAVGVTLLIGLVLLTHILDLVHGVLGAVWDGVLGPAAIGALLVLSRLFGNSGQQQLTGIMRTMSTAGQAAPRVSRHVAAQGHLPWANILAVVGAVAVLLLARAYMRYRATREPGQPWWRVFPALLAEARALLRALWRPARGLAGHLALRAAVAASTLETRRRQGARRTGELGPRALIAYLYEQALAAAARLGHARRPGQTPGEFADELGARLGAGRGAFDDLTATFAEARYSGHEVRQDLAERAQASWKTLRENLKAARRPPR